MKKYLAILWSAIIGLFPITVFAQENNESEIRELEKISIEAIVKGDTALLFNKYWSPALVVNIPTNKVATLDEIKNRFRAGQIDYSTGERSIDKITFNENIAIVMGQEIIRPQGTSEHAGKTITRRFMNIWMKTTDSWRMVARQATIISVL